MPQSAFLEALVYQDRIREIYSHLSAGYRRVADFILNNYREMAFMTAGQVAAVCSVDTAQVVRFAQRLDYPGYPELLAEVQSEVKRDLRAVYEWPLEEKSPIGVYQRSLIADSNSLQFMLHHLDASTIEKVRDVLQNAPRIFVIGEGVGSYLAEALTLRLAALGFNIHAIPGDLHGRIAMTAGIRPGDAVIGLDMTLLTRSIGIGLRLAREDGARTIAIVNSAANHAAGVAEYVLYAPANTVGLFYSMTACVAVLHALVLALTAGKDEAAADWAVRSDRQLRLYTSAWREPSASVSQVVGDYIRHPGRGDDMQPPRPAQD